MRLRAEVFDLVFLVGTCCRRRWLGQHFFDLSRYFSDSANAHVTVDPTILIRSLVLCALAHAADLADLGSGSDLRSAIAGKSCHLEGLLLLEMRARSRASDTSRRGHSSSNTLRWASVESCSARLPGGRDLPLHSLSLTPSHRLLIAS